MFHAVFYKLCVESCKSWPHLWRRPGGRENKCSGEACAYDAAWSSLWPAGMDCGGDVSRVGVGGCVGTRKRKRSGRRSREGNGCNDEDDNEQQCDGTTTTTYTVINVNLNTTTFCHSLIPLPLAITTTTGNPVEHLNNTVTPLAEICSSQPLSLPPALWPASAPQLRRRG